MNTVPTLDELRSFLHLDARGELDGVKEPDVVRQEQTVLRALEVLRDRPGVVLADEVGMGKTFEALGIVAAFREAAPKSRVVILTPGPDLNTKWVSELHRFQERSKLGRCVYDFGLPRSTGDREGDSGDHGPSCRTLAELIERLKTFPIVVAPITAFGSAGGAADRSYLLSLFFRDSHGNTLNAALARLNAKPGRPHERVDVHEKRFLDAFPLEKIERHLSSAFGGGRDHKDDALAPLYEEKGLDLFDDPGLVKRALELAKFRLVRALLPDIDLLVVDEAHKLKNADGVRVRGVLTAFHRKFNKALFLTATPFQLDVGELRQVFRLFEHAKDPGPPGNRGETWPEAVRRDADVLLEKVRDYQAACDDLQDAWSRLDAAGAAAFRTHYEAHGESTAPSSDPELEPIAQRAREVRKRKDEVAPLFRAWMIRSLREEKRVYRTHTTPTLPDAGASAIPFLLYERLIAELFRTGVGTHKAAVEINLVSSFGAARTGALLSGDAKELTPSVVEYRDLLKEVLAVTEPPAKHPSSSGCSKTLSMRLRAGRRRSSSARGPRPSRSSARRRTDAGGRACSNFGARAYRRRRMRTCSVKPARTGETAARERTTMTTTIAT